MRPHLYFHWMPSNCEAAPLLWWGSEGSNHIRNNLIITCHLQLTLYHSRHPCHQQQYHYHGHGNTYPEITRENDLLATAVQTKLHEHLTNDGLLFFVILFTLANDRQQSLLCLLWFSFGLSCVHTMYLGIYFNWVYQHTTNRLLAPLLIRPASSRLYQFADGDGWTQLSSQIYIPRTIAS